MAGSNRLPPSVMEQVDSESKHCAEKFGKGTKKYYECFGRKEPTLTAYHPPQNFGGKLREIWENRAFDRTGEQTFHKLLRATMDEFTPAQDVEGSIDKMGDAYQAAKEGHYGAAVAALGAASKQVGEGILKKSPLGRVADKAFHNSKHNVQVKKKKKKKLKCGEGGTYATLKKKLAQVVGLERDHVPSSAALKRRALALNMGRRLSDSQLRKVENIGHTLAIPKGIHMDFSLTYKSLNDEALISKDANNLSKAATRDLRAIKKGLDPECKKQYEKYAKKIRKITNQEYDVMLKKALQGK